MFQNASDKISVTHARVSNCYSVRVNFDIRIIYRINKTVSKPGSEHYIQYETMGNTQ